MKTIGILALQGAFEEHKKAMERLGVQAFEIRQRADLTKQRLDGIILPGGESTVIGKLLVQLELLEPLKQEIEEGLPVFGTCAGLILLAKKISDEEKHYLDAMDITVKRNAYGRQLGSFCTMQPFQGLGNIPMTFIRAPYIEAAEFDRGVEVLARVDGHIVAAMQKNILVTAFHPELTSDLRVHRYFLSRCA